MSTKLRVYEVARDLGMDNKALVALLQSLGVSEVRNHMSAVAPEVVDRLKRHQEKASSQKTVEEHIRPTVVKRRAVKRPDSEEPHRSAPPSDAVVAARTPTPKPPAPPLSAPVAKLPSIPLPPVIRPEPIEPPVEAPAGAAEELAVSSRVELPREPESAPPPAPPPVEVSVPAAASTAPAPGESDVVAEREPVQAESAPRVETPSIADQPATGAEPESVAVPREVAAPHAEPTVVPEGEARGDAAGAVEPSAAPRALSGSVEEPSPQSPAPAAEPLMKSEAHRATARARVPEPAAPQSSPARPQPSTTPSARPQPAVSSAPRPTSAPKTGIDVWEGRPGVPMPQAPRGPMPRRVQYDAKAGVSQSGPRGRGGPASMGNRQGRAGMRNRGIGSMAKPRGSGQPVTQERSAHKKVVKIEGSVGLQTLGNRMGIKAHELLRKLVMLGLTGVNINSTLDAETAKIVANEFGWEVEDVAVSEEDALVAAQGIEEETEDGLQEPRPPVVTVMGHVDHGKTSLLDRIRRANVVSGEAGGITQHVGAYSVKTPKGLITFLDTPGHAAFSQMRARGAQCTDVVVLVVAADDGVMPQTKEAIAHARNAKVPIVVAVNKVDKPEAQPERVRRELSDQGLIPEEWGGDTLFSEVSATTGAGIDGLLEQILLQAEVLELGANPNKPASGIVIEAQLDRGKGPVATVLVTDGTLSTGDVILAGHAFGKIRAMLDHNGKRLAVALPSTPVAVIGLNDVPSAGDPVHAVRDMKKAQEIAESRRSKDKDRRGLISGGARMTLDDLAKAMGQAEQLEFKVIVKADVQGSVEALGDALQQLSTAKVKVSVVQAAVGAITEGDVNLATASGAIIIGFNVRPAGKAAQLAQQEAIEIRQYSIIYNVLEDITSAMEGMLAPELVESVIGQAEVRQVFKLSKAGIVAGSMILSGVVKRTAQVRAYRDKALVWTGKISGLKRFKEDVKEVKEGFDCGISIDGFSEVREGDLLEVFDIKEVKQKL